jgi:hypothetical protein
MKLPKELTTVTPLSKTIALIMFTSLPIIAFFFGMNYQKALTEQSISTTQNIVACTEDARICPDGTTVGRVAPDCKFAECPSGQPTPAFCGGIAGKMCPHGYICEYDGTYPDAGGKCVRGVGITKYTCPDTEYVDCMPGPDAKNPLCGTDFLTWANQNCPNFKGVAY